MNYISISSPEMQENSQVTADDRFYSHGPRPPRSSLAPLQLSRPRTREEMQQLAQEVWRQRGLALFDPLLIDDAWIRQALVNEANRLYGRRATTSPEVR